MLGQPPQPLQLGEQVESQAAGAGTDFQNVSSAEPEHLGGLLRQGLAKQGGDFRGGDKIACGAELVHAGAVVAKAGRIQGQLHEAAEGNPAAVGLDFTTDQGGGLFAVFQRGRVGCG